MTLKGTIKRGEHFGNSKEFTITSLFSKLFRFEYIASTPKSSDGNLKGIKRNEKLPSISIIY